MEQLPSGEGGDQQPQDRASESQRRRTQRFQFGPWLFNVDKAQAIVAEQPRELAKLPVTPWARFYGLDSPEREASVPLFTPLLGFDRDYAMTTDLSDPVLVARLRTQAGEEFPLLIDGTHRLFHAWAVQLAELPTYVLSAEETLAIREDGLVAGQIYWPSHDSARLVDGTAESDGGAGR